jgi:hypothetical protein
MTKTGFIILFILITIGALVFIEIAGMPGRDARKRGHPNAEAISLLGWLGLPLGVFGWLLAMVWARYRPTRAEVAGMSEENEAQDDQLTQRTISHPGEFQE